MSRKLYFYVVNTVPELSFLRIKFGQSIDVNARFKQHISICPTAILLGSYLLGTTSERSAIDYISSHAAVKLNDEMYDFYCSKQYLIELVEYYFVSYDLQVLTAVKISRNDWYPESINTPAKKKDYNRYLVGLCKDEVLTGVEGSNYLRGEQIEN